MLKGDLVTTPLPVVLRQLADGHSSGCLHVRDSRAEEGRVFLRAGRVYAVQVAGERPLLGQYLVSSGALGPEMLAEALEAQRTELQGWKLGELVVHLGYVEPEVVEAFLREQLLDQFGDLVQWPTGTWKFRVNERTREDVAPLEEVEGLLRECAHRSREWAGLLGTVHGPEAVPVLSALGATDDELAIDPEAWSLLCKVDGQRTLSELAMESGFTLHQAGLVVGSLVHAGLLEIEEPVLEQSLAPAIGVMSRLAAAFAPTGTTEAAPTQAAASEVVDPSLDIMSHALSALLAPTVNDDLFAPRPRRETQPSDPTPDEQARRERGNRRRTADADELQRAQALLESARDTSPLPTEAAPLPLTADRRQDAEIVSLATVRREALLRGDREGVAAQEARLREAEEVRLRAAEEARIADRARRAEQEEQAQHARAQQEWQAEQDRLAEQAQLENAERARLEQLRIQQEAAAREAEQARAAEQAARQAVEAERLAAEAQFAEQARQAEEQRIAQQAQLAQEAEAAQQREQARLAAEAEAAQQREQARLAAEAEAAQQREQARLAQEAAAAAAQQHEQARLAQEAEAAAAAAAAQQHEQARLAQEAEAEAAQHAAAAATRALQTASLPPESPAAGDSATPEALFRAQDTDMASLFRELSSLGNEDDATTPPPPPRQTPRPVVPSQQSKKKKGLFGR